MQSLQSGSSSPEVPDFLKDLSISDEDFIEMDRILCEGSLSEFVRGAWPYIDPAHYLHNWHIDAKCEYLEAVARGECRRLVINEPPRHMKSIVTTIAFPAWVWAQKPIRGADGIRLPTCGPHAEIFSLSYSGDLSTDHAVKSRDLISSPWYQDRWRDRFQFKGDVNLKTKYENTKGGRRQASSVGGKATGLGGSIIIVDDPHNVQDGESDAVRESTVRWYFETLSTRLNDPKRGAFIVVMQRVNERDVTGEILARELGYEHLCLPARYESDHPFVWKRDPRNETYLGDIDTPKGDGALLWNERFSQKEIDELETALGQYGAAGQLQQRPAPRAGGFFDKAWFDVLDAIPAGVKILRRVRKWDLAATKDIGKLDPSWTVGLLMSLGDDGVYYIEHVTRFRENPGETERRIKDQAKADGYGVPILLPQDPGQAGKFQVEYLVKQLAGWVVRYEPESGDKAKRAEPISSQAKVRNVKLIRGVWVNNFLDEYASFPMARHNDQVDAGSGAFNFLTKPTKAAMIIGGGR